MNDSDIDDVVTSLISRLPYIDKIIYHRKIGNYKGMFVSRYPNLKKKKCYSILKIHKF